MTGLAIRPLAPADAPVVAGLVRANRAYMAPWDPVRDETYYTDEGQREIIATVLTLDNVLPYVILADGAIVGRITLSNVVRGPFLSASLGYWVAERHTGRGAATAAVAAIVREAFTVHGLHRVEAGTLLHNVRSQRVLERNGFVRFGMAPRYLRIAGDWRDHYLFQLLAEDWPPAKHQAPATADRTTP